MSVWTDNAAAFATTQPSAIDAERHAGVRKALGLVVGGQPGRALYELTRSVQRQARIAGVGQAVIHPGCPCGGRCERGQAVRA